MLIVYFFSSFVPQSSDLNVTCQRLEKMHLLEGEGKRFYQGLKSKRWDKAEEFKHCTSLLPLFGVGIDQLTHNHVRLPREFGRLSRINDQSTLNAYRVV